MKWVLLLRAVNLGPTNKIAMKDLRAVLDDLGHAEIKTYLNSGNASFESPARSARRLADDVEAALRKSLNLEIRCCIRKVSDLARALDELPELPGYVAITVLFDKPSAAALRDFLATDWSPERVEGNDQVLYIGFQNAAKTKLSNARIEKALGISATARTPNTLRRIVDATR